ncbi:sulfatase-like hydrolase/transferase, partial [Akkermansiaceae bacterium]|nr:sulfatase-like hydrolase/transferase [Akkermansiaceae bacterium]
LPVMIRSLLCCFLFSSCPLGAKQKNVLFFFIDDLRPELGCYGQKGIRSPHIDALATEGVLFERAYCQQAICAPSRISMLSGQYPDSTGIDDLWTPLRKVQPDAMSMPRYFKERGFVTASFGKVYHHQRDDKKYWTEHLDRPGVKYASKEVQESMERRKQKALKNGATALEASSASSGSSRRSIHLDILSANRRRLGLILWIRRPSRRACRRNWCHRELCNNLGRSRLEHHR